MPVNSDQSLNWAHPLIREWFKNKVGTPTLPQARGWPAILAKKTTLISAPTGSGKTFAAFLTCIDQLLRHSLNGELKDQTYVLYVSPLKALGNDIQKNLNQPLHEIAQLAKSRGHSLPAIRVAVRSGDTPPRERQQMLKKPPHILVTTPESLYILLTAEKSRAMLQSVQTIIIDEIHAIANDKRGTHLSLSLARLDALCQHSPTRIGLSATQKPIELVADFLLGNKKSELEIINIGHSRPLELTIEVPASELGAVASNELWDEIYDKIAKLTAEHRSILVFVNTRKLSERMAHHLAERMGSEYVAAHHGSLSRKIRLTAETKLKNGELKILVATASLELGIDIGAIDLVCQIGSPRAIAVALQRVGRAGHFQGGISKGKFFATTRDELLECAALIKAIHEGDLDRLIMPEEPLDILAQQIIATCATNDWQEEKLFQLIKESFAYNNITFATFDAILTMLSEGIAGSRGRFGAFLFRDQVNGLIKARRGSRLTAITNGGAIPDNGLYTVVAEPQETIIGTLDEDFAVESNRGDIILLGNTSWQIKRIENATGRVIVADAKGAPPSVPFWRGEAPNRSNELSLHVSQLREILSQQLPQAYKTIQGKENSSEIIHTLKWLKKNCGVNEHGAKQLIEYILQGRAILGAIPSQKTIIAERFFDESGGMQLVIHAPFGARINKAWGLALRKRFCRSFNFELQAAATDDGLNIALAEQHSFPLADVFYFLHPNSIKEVLIQAVLQSPIFNTRWRWNATRSLALSRFRRGKKVPPNIQRMLSDDLLAAVFPDAAACQDNLAGKDITLPDHPLINETIKDCLHEALDIDGLTELLNKILHQEIQCLAVDTPTPSSFSHEILNANPYAYLDDAPLEERRARAVEMRRMLPESLLESVGKLDQQAILEVQQQSWPDIRNADELHDVLQTMIAFPHQLDLNPNQSSTTWQIYFAELLAAKRITLATIDGKKFWVCAEKLKTFSAIYTNAIFNSILPDIKQEIPTREDAIINLLRGWLLYLGPTHSHELASLLNLEITEIDQALLKLETTGLILRGHFRTNAHLEWCERRILARIHRLTISRLRKEIAPVNATQFMQWLLTWQHLAPNTQLRDEQGLIEIIKQLQGFELAANAWEKQIFSKRLSDYDSETLDRLCLMGIIGWGRFSTHSAVQSNKKRIKPMSNTPITFFIRENSSAIFKNEKFNEEIYLTILTPAAKLVYDYLKQKGASFFNDILHASKKLKSEVENALWELVTAGLITADGFDNLRSLIDRKRRLNKRGRRRQPLFVAGRWSILHTGEIIDTQQKIATICWILLKRYGVVFRDILTREKNLPPWRELVIAFRRLEDRGEIRGGRFVNGFAGEQFALVYAVDSLRAMSKQSVTHENISLAAADPLNLYGIILPGERVPAISGKTIVL